MKEERKRGEREGGEREIKGETATKKEERKKEREKEGGGERELRTLVLKD